MDSIFSKFNLGQIIENLDIKWTLIILGVLFLTYIVGKSFLQLFSSLWEWIVIVFAIAIVLAPEFNVYVRDKIMLIILKARSFDHFY